MMNYNFIQKNSGFNNPFHLLFHQQRPFLKVICVLLFTTVDVLEFDVMVSNDEKAKCDSCMIINGNNEYSFSRIRFPIN